MNPNVKKALSVAAHTFGAAVIGYLLPLLGEGIPTTGTQLKSMAISAVMVGLTAVVHLFQDKPGSISISVVPPLGVLMLMLMTGCTAAQAKKVETGIPADAQLIGCVIATALASGGNLLAVATACGTDAVTAGQILVQAITSTSAMTAAQAAAEAKIAATPAAKEAMSTKK
jgi:hypothetical protein